MSKRAVHFHAAAEGEVLQAIRYYEEREPDLGAAFYAELRRALDLVSDFPDVGVELWDTRRRLLLNRFPYGIVYRVLHDGSVRVLAVMHLRREPEYWRTRQ